MADETKDVRRVRDTDANIDNGASSTLIQKQIGFTSDTHKLAFRDTDDTIYTYTPEGADVTGGNLYTEKLIGHVGDLDTVIDFTTNDILIKAGNITGANFTIASVEFNKNEVDYDFIVNADSITDAFVIEGSSGNVSIAQDLTVTGDISGANLYTADLIGHTGDPDTYLDFSPDVLEIVAGGYNKVYVGTLGTQFNNLNNEVDFFVLNASGTSTLTVNGLFENVGINTNTPDENWMLDVQGNTRIRSTSETGQLQLSYDATKYVSFTVDTNYDLTIKPQSTGQLKFLPSSDSTDFIQASNAAAESFFRIDSTNKRMFIGEKVASPERTMQVYADGGTNAKLTIGSGSPASGASYLGALTYHSYYLGTFYEQALITSYADATWGVYRPANLAFWVTATDSTTPAIKMTLEQTGHLSLGAPSTDDSRLNVDGDIKVEATGTYYIGDVGTDGSWRITRENDDLVFQRRESSSWVEKLKIED